MIGSSRTEYIFIRSCIFALHYIAPLSILYCLLVVAFYGVRATRYPFPIVVEAVAVAETLFFLVGYLPYRKFLQHEAVHPPVLSRVDRKALFERCNENIPDCEAYIRKWFLGAPLEDIKRENLKDFLLWAFFNRGGPPGDDNEELEEYVSLTEKLLGQEILPGRGKATCLRLTLDEVDMLHRSLVWYFCVGFVDFLTYLNLLRNGFSFYRTPLTEFFKLFPFRPITLLTKNKSSSKHLSYWYRPHTSKTKLPIVFVHGIGIGLYPYVNFLAGLNSKSGLETGGPDDQVGIIAIEIMPVSFRISRPALPKEEMCAEVAKILAQHGWDKVVLVSHSYGTVVSTHLVKSVHTSHLVGPVVLIDPVSILLHLPDVAYNFTRRQPEKANEHQLYYFASMDMSVSHTLSRHFFWSENVLWKEDMAGRNFTVSLSGQDLIVNTNAVGNYLASDLVRSQDGSNDDTTDLIDFPESSHRQSSNGTKHSKVNGNGNGNGNSITKIAEQEESDDEEVSWKTRTWQGRGLDLLWFDNLDHAQVFDKPSTRRPLVTAIKAYCSQKQE